MITQTIKGWLSKLFAWWPWKRSSENAYTQPIGKVNRGTTQDAVWRALVMDGLVPQPGSTSVAVDQGMDESIPEPPRASADERSEHPTPSPIAPSGENRPSSHAASHEAMQDKKTTSPEKSVLVPSPEQQLAFLHYLVRRGTFNEGFAEEQIPGQYKEKKN